MDEFTVTIETEPKTATDDTFLDRLGEIVYADERFISPAIGLDDDGSLSFVFNVHADDLPAATELATKLVGEAVARVQRGDAMRKAVTAAALAVAILLIARVAIERAPREMVAA